MFLKQCDWRAFRLISTFFLSCGLVFGIVLWLMRIELNCCEAWVPENPKAQPLDLKSKICDRNHIFQIECQLAAAPQNKRFLVFLSFRFYIYIFENPIKTSVCWGSSRWKLYLLILLFSSAFYLPSFLIFFLRKKFENTEKLSFFAFCLTESVSLNTRIVVFRGQICSHEKAFCKY